MKHIYTVNSSYRFINTILFIVFISISILALAIIQSPFSWIGWVSIIFWSKYFSGLLIYGIIVNNLNKTITIRKTLGSITFDISNIKEWGYRYYVVHASDGPLTAIFIEIHLINGKIIRYPIHVGFEFLLNAADEKEFLSIFPSPRQKYLDDKGPIWLTDIRAWFYQLYFFWI